MPRLAVISLGCSKNLVDSENLVGTLRGLGFTLTAQLAAADLILINTCGFIADAKQESIDHILEAAAGRRPGAKLLVAGCLTTRYLAELRAELPEVDAWLPLADYPRLPRVLATLFPDLPRVQCPGPPCRLTPPHLANIKISEGCDSACHFCAIPLIRGPHVSRPFTEIVAQVADCAAAGVRELALIAQRLDHYGHDLPGQAGLPDLVRAVAAAAPRSWVRLHYCYPEGIDTGLLAAMADCANVVPYLDVPVQHASDRVLRRMGRSTGRRQLEDGLASVRAWLPDVVLRTIFLVGHPGEREADVAELIEFIEAQRFDLAGCFGYSAEEGTVSARMRDQVPEAEIAARRDRVLTAQAAVHAARLERWCGRELRVLVEARNADGTWNTRHYGQAADVDNCTRVVADELPIGDFVRVRVTGADGYDLLGEGLRRPQSGVVEAEG